MSNDLSARIRALIEGVENMKAADTAGLSDVEIARTEGHRDGMTTLAAQFKALVEEKPKKPLTMGSKVRITRGPYQDQKGYFQGLQHTVLGPQAEIIIENVDLPVLVNQEHIEVV